MDSSMANVFKRTPSSCINPDIINPGTILTNRLTHQLRHNAATFLRKEFGLETARIIRSAAITEVYAVNGRSNAAT
jgi:hypothetical protein